MKTAVNKDDIKMLKVEYLSNHLLDLPQHLNLSLGDPTDIEQWIILKFQIMLLVFL